MAVNSVNNPEKRSNVISLRLTDKELKRLHTTLRNFGIKQSSVSDALRLFLTREYYRSLKIARERAKAHKQAPSLEEHAAGPALPAARPDQPPGAQQPGNKIMGPGWL
jgi:hypothetical protein